MKSSIKNTQNFGLVNRFKNTKLYKWLSKKKLFFIRSVAHSNNPPLCDESVIIQYHEFNPQFKGVIDRVLSTYDELLILDKIVTQIKENKDLFKKYNFTLELSDGEETQQLI